MAFTDASAVPESSFVHAAPHALLHSCSFAFIGGQTFFVDNVAVERLKWRSRRGLLELDLVFERFWAGPGKDLEEGEAKALEVLLALPDNDLLDLVMRRAESPEAHLRGLLEKLRAV